MFLDSTWVQGIISHNSLFDQELYIFSQLSNNMISNNSMQYSFFQIASAATETMFCFIGYTMS